MTLQRFAAAGLALAAGLMLASCSGFSGFMADHWPHFAGGEPDGIPPRPGEAGYAQFIAHTEGKDGSPPLTRAPPSAAPSVNAAGAPQRPSAPATVGALASEQRRTPTRAKEPIAADKAEPDPADANALRGGLY
jgi:hypothetical protein